MTNYQNHIFGIAEMFVYISWTFSEGKRNRKASKLLNPLEGGRSGFTSNKGPCKHRVNRKQFRDIIATVLLVSLAKTIIHPWNNWRHDAVYSGSL